MRKYAAARSCRREHILDYFGEACSGPRLPVFSKGEILPQNVRRYIFPTGSGRVVDDPEASC
jgi:hypothetical protein